MTIKTDIRVDAPAKLAGTTRYIRDEKIDGMIAELKGCNESLRYIVKLMEHIVENMVPRRKPDVRQMLNKFTEKLKKENPMVEGIFNSMMDAMDDDDIS